MDEDKSTRAPGRRSWFRLIRRILLVLLAIALVFHRPILFGVGRTVAKRYAAQENLKIDCSLGGTIFTNLVVENLHVVPTGPALIESVDVDQIRLDYSLWDLMFQGLTEVLKNAEVRTAHIVLDPAKAPPQTQKEESSKPATLFSVFPGRLRLSDINLRIRSTGENQDFVLEHFDLDLSPREPGALHLATMQLPGGRIWRNLSAQTSYSNKKLVVADLALDDENQFRLIAIDASHIQARSIEIVIDATVVGGSVAGSIALSERTRSLQSKARLTIEKISLDKLSSYFGQSSAIPSGEIDRVLIESNGAIDSPRTWDAKVEAQVRDLRWSSFSLDHCEFNLSAHDGLATLRSAKVSRGTNRVELTGTAELPAEMRALGQAPASLEIVASFPDLESFTAGFVRPLSGSLAVQGRAEIRDAILHCNATVHGSSISFDQGEIAQLDGDLVASKKMPSLDSKEIYYKDLQTEVHFHWTGLRFGEYQADSAEIGLRSNGPAAKLERLAVIRNQNVFTLTGDYQFPEKFDAFLMQPAEFAVSLDAPQFGDYWLAGSSNKITGPVQLTGEAILQRGKAQGAVSLYGSNLSNRDLVIRQLSAEASIWDGDFYLNDLTVSLNEKDFVVATGMLSVKESFPYRGRVQADIADLARLKPLLIASGNDSEIGGSLLVDWEGSGEAKKFKNTGSLKLKVEKGRYADLRALQASVEASYTPEALNIPIIFLGSEKMNCQATLTAKDSTLEVTEIAINQGEAKYASGYVSLPFVWKNIGTEKALFSSDGKVMVAFETENLDLKRLFEDLGFPAKASGLVTVKLDAQGTLAQLPGKLELHARDLRSANYPKIEPATFDLVADLKENRLSIDGRLQQARIQPVRIAGSLPFDLSKIVSDRKLDEETPVDLKVQMPRSSVNFLRQFLPGVTQLDGDMAVDANIGGTLAKPSLSGSGDISINVARLSDPTLPNLSGFHSRMKFDGDTLSFERFTGDLAGGPFTITGRVTFPKLIQPNLDFQLKSQSILVARNDSLTVRADADLKVTGLWSSATVAGTVALTNSQFLKNIDLLPIGLPGRPAPQPPSDRPDFSITDPPLRDWKFDLKIKTKDPFLIRGNLANGGAIVDLNLTGTGLHPALQGLVRLQKVEATLPFSRMEVTQGFLYFDPNDSFNPRIDLNGTSLIRDYTVHVYVYGTLLSPEAIFSSEPPLPQEEIISLLATGVTREELTGNNNVLAGRAAVLLFKQLYQKIFKKGQETQAPQTTSALDRLRVEIGTVDPRTGQQTATARYKINDKFVLIGEVAVGGDFRGMVKYLIRFR